MGCQSGVTGKHLSRSACRINIGGGEPVEALWPISACTCKLEEERHRLQALQAQLAEVRRSAQCLEEEHDGINAKCVHLRQLIEEKQKKALKLADYLEQLHIDIDWGQQILTTYTRD